MLQRLRQMSAGWLVAALYALAVTASGLAHQPISGSAAASIVQTIDLAAYAMPDGSIPALCLHDDGAPAGETHASQRCDACALSAAPGLAPVAQDIVHAPVVRSVAFAISDEGQYLPLSRHAPVSRGPPAA